MQPNLSYFIAAEFPTIELEIEAQHRQFALLERLTRHEGFSNEFDIDGPCGYFCGRPVIGPFTRVHGGVHPGVKPREAIVVDEEHGDLHAVYMELLVNYLRKFGNHQRIEPGQMLPLVSSIVKEKISLRPEALPQLHQRKGIKKDEKVALDLYVNSGIGVERHQVLLAAYLVEKLIERGLINGVMHFEIVLDKSQNERERVVYYSPDGKTYCYDPRMSKSEMMLNNLLS